MRRKCQSSKHRLVTMRKTTEWRQRLEADGTQKQIECTGVLLEWNETHLGAIWVGIWSRFNILIADSSFEIVPPGQGAFSASTVSRRDASKVSAIVSVVADGVLSP